MLFTSVHFIVFFLLITLTYYLIPHRFRWCLLLAASYYFYMSWDAWYVLLLIVTTLVAYTAAIIIRKAQRRTVKKAVLAAALTVHLGLLFFFKYLNFFSASLTELLKSVTIPLNPLTVKLLLPVGISFFTFQTIGYLIDVYRTKVEPERHIGIMALYVSFFPQLLAGPIERAHRLIPQLRAHVRLNIEQIRSGVLLMLWGFFKKLVIADMLVIYVDYVYADPTKYSGIAYAIATVLFAFQLYCDFSGYTDIALGVAQVLGISLMQNFNRPYLARSVADFWRRWHISLSTWFQDYVFTPLYLALSKRIRLKAVAKHAIAFPVSMLIGLTLLGLWHGANWTYVLFGLYYGVLVSLYYFTRKWWDRMPMPLQIAFTFIIVNIGWIIFKCKDLADLSYIFSHLFVFNLHHAYLLLSGIGIPTLLIIAISVAILETVEAMQNNKRVLAFLSPDRWYLWWIICALLVWSILVFGTFSNAPFVYFQF
jgi:alginate O-acetyltransferase complex protein AlgI